MSEVQRFNFPLTDAKEAAGPSPAQQHASEGHKLNMLILLWQSAGLRAGGDMQTVTQ